MALVVDVLNKINKGRGNVTHTILPKPHLWNYTRYVAVVVESETNNIYNMNIDKHL